MISWQSLPWKILAKLKLFKIKSEKKIIRKCFILYNTKFTWFNGFLESYLLTSYKEKSKPLSLMYTTFNIKMREFSSNTMLLLTMGMYWFWHYSERPPARPMSRLAVCLCCSDPTGEKGWIKLPRHELLIKTDKDSCYPLCSQ